jgi:hypothetical protein
LGLGNTHDPRLVQVDAQRLGGCNCERRVVRVVLEIGEDDTLALLD